MPVAPPPTEPTQSTDPSGVTLLGSAARAASGTGSIVEVLAQFAYVTFELLVTSVPAPGTLDVYVQQVLDGTNFDDVVHFAQVAGGGAAQGQGASFAVRRADAAPEVHTWQDQALGAASVRDVVLGRKFRVAFVIAGGGSWTFAVYAWPRTPH